MLTLTYQLLFVTCSLTILYNSINNDPFNWNELDETFSLFENEFILLKMPFWLQIKAAQSHIFACLGRVRNLLESGVIELGKMANVHTTSDNIALVFHTAVLIYPLITYSFACILVIIRKANEKRRRYTSITIWMLSVMLIVFNYDK